MSIIKAPVFMLLCGDAGSGKTTLASRFPKPRFLDTEQGTNFLDIPTDSRVPCDSTADVGKALSTFKGSPGTTLVVDTMTELERYLRDTLCAKHNAQVITDIGGGFGKGSYLLLAEFERLLKILLRIRAEGSHVVLICHGTVNHFANPSGEDYDCHSVDMARRVQELFTRRADAVLYLSQQVKKLDTTGDIGQSDVRELICTNGDGHKAKNRYGMPHRIGPFVNKPDDFKILWQYLERFIP